MKYHSFLTLSNDRKNVDLTLIFDKYIKTDDEAVNIVLARSLVGSSDNQLLKTTITKYERAAATRSPKDTKLFWDALDQLSNGEADEIVNIFEFTNQIQTETFNDFIMQLPFRTRVGILFSFIKTKDFQVN